MDSTGSSVSEAGQFDSGYFQDPLGYFARIRDEGPVRPVTLPGSGQFWAITGYDNVRAALADPRLHRDRARLAGPDYNPEPATALRNVNMLAADPPDHTRLRKLATQAFTARRITARRITALRPRIEEITASLLDAMAAAALDGRSEIDLVEAFAFPLPAMVICELLGVPARDREELKSWSKAILSSVAGQADVIAAGTSTCRYFTELIAAKRESPADDLISALVDARGSGDSLDEQELHSMLFLLLTASYETTMNLIASGTLALLTHPAELSRLRADPSLLPGAVEELLRYANPLNHATKRFTLESVTIGGVTIPARSWVLCVISSANRDPDRYSSPDVLDVGRDASGHLAFGYGIHFCPGASLARLEGEIAFGALLSRFPSLALAIDPSELRWRPSSFIHGLEKLPVRLG
jgi:cytochrome P450